MKKVLCLIVGFMLISAPTAFAFGDFEDNSNNYDQDQKQKQQQGQLQGQAQGQVGINKQSAVGQGNTTSVSSHDDTEVITAVWAPTPSTAGKEEGKVYTIFGGVDTNEPSREVRVDHHIKTLKLFKQEGIISDDEYVAEMRLVYERLKQQNGQKRVLGLLWKTEGRHVANLFGLASVDDLRGKLHKASGDDEVTGNGGNVN